eukprot:CAMPEP_0197317808 /NCGR_PEP_ID=MMETSP0891-20130614/48617_1 /TAXON_ID=44058 ORGANISM="Aureoumbra lagunensis, Strain CCMP1510" /NCGR_SAMPLE_ID=MMETSP0891 /ASSEMBLY_ACC=CAM_ASM_000534 /LENGTH=120 /DNA_ID=CAMNT_0042807979 /DNA_START=394 /DNA_END=753 /DNA_ORIENTATION=-
METCLCLLLLAHIASTRHGVLCQMADTLRSRFVFLALYGWSSASFFLCARVEDEAGRSGVVDKREEDTSDDPEEHADPFYSAAGVDFESQGLDDIDSNNNIGRCFPCIGKVKIQGARRAG